MFFDSRLTNRYLVRLVLGISLLMGLLACQPQDILKVVGLQSHFSIIGQNQAELIIGQMNYLGQVSDRLIKIEADFAGQVDLYLVDKKEDQLIHRQVQSIDLLPKQIYSSRSREHQQIHIMLVGLKRPLIKGKYEEVTFYFEKAKPIKTKLVVLDTPEGESHDHHH